MSSLKNCTTFPVFCPSGKMIEQAKEELEMLETQHPNRFGYLKMELKSFIFLLDSQYNNSNNNDNPSPCSLVPLQLIHKVSSTSMSRKRDKGGSESEIYKMVCRNGAFKLKRMHRIDLVLEKAQSCLQKIQQLKSGLCN